MAKVIAVGGSNNSNSSSNSSTISACGSNSSCDKDPATYSKEREGFLRDLQHFHETKGTPFKRPPIIGGKEVDLYQLYTLVTGQGGWIKVNSRNAWNQILEQLHLPHYCVNGGVALKQIYLRYLDRWEKLHFLGEEGDRGSDDDEESRHKRWSARALHSVPHTYNYVQHNVADANREYNHLSTTVYKQSDYDRLALSLISSLPNEQDFAINVCTLLSNDGKHTLKLEKYPRLLDYLLGHAGVFCHSSLRKLFVDCYSTVRKHPIHNFWREVLEFGEFVDLTNENNFIKKPLLRVIKKEHDALAATTSSSAQFKEESEFVTDLLTEQRLPRNGDPACETDDDGDSDSDCGEVTNCNKKFKFTIEPSDKDLFCLERGLGTQDYIGQRVLQVTTILRNLSFVEENVSILLKNRTFLRFLLLCSSSRWGHLRNLGLDMLGNVASEFLVKDYPNDRLAVVLLKIITYGLRSEDRTCCISALEVLNKLSQNEANEDVLLRTLEPEVYERVCSFLTIHDVMLLIYTLECLYSLSSLGERSCNLIVNNHGVVDTLVSLVTVEGKSYGPKACIGMKLVETVPGGNSNSSSNSSAAAAATATATSQSQPAGGGVTSPPTSSSSSTTSATTSTTPALVTSTATVPSQTLSTVAATSSIVSTTVSSSGITTSIMSSANKLQTINSCSITPTKPSLITSTPTRPVPIAPQRLVSIAPNSSTSNTAATTTTMTSSLASSSTSSSASSIIQQQAAQQLIQQQHAHQQAIHENEQFALAWLRANFEPCANGKVDHQELYKQYLNACSKIGRRGVISPLHFPRCVRSVFGGTVGPNPMKPTNPTEPQYYEGIKVRAQPLIINIPPPPPPQPVSTNNPSTHTTNTSTPAAAKGHGRRKQNLKPNKSNNNSSPITISSLINSSPLQSALTIATTPENKTPSNVNINNNADDNNTASLSPNSSPIPSVVSSCPPASPILKAQLSAPPKQRDAPTTASATSKGDAKSQVMAHPHLSQALLGSVSSSSLSAASAVAAGPSGKDTTTNLNTTTNQVGQTTSIATTITTSTAIATNTSLIKSLLATKVNDCMTTTVSMRTATDCQNVAQVVARQQQQRLLAQQTCTPSPPAANKVIIKTDPDASTATPKICRMNGARQLFTDPEAVADPSVTSTTQFTNLVKSVKKEPPQPPPPPLAPLSGGNSAPGGACMKIVHNKTATRIDNEDSDSIGNNSVASSSGMGMIGIGGISSTEDCDNSLTSFEGLLNGMPNMDNPLINEDSDSKDFVRLMSTNNDIQRNKPLRLADLLEKKVEKTPPPIMNGNLGKELRLGDKTVDLVENHIEKALNSSRTDNNNTSSSSNNESHNNNAHNHDNGSSSGIGYSNMIVDTSSIKTEMIVDTSSIKTEMIVDTSSIKTEISDDQIDAVAAPAAGSTTTTTTTGNPSQGVKRPAPSDDAISDSEAKRPCLTTTSSSSVAMATSNNVNGSSSAPSTTAGNSPAPESVSSSNGDEATAQSTTSVTVSTAAAKLFADFAADIMEDEDEEQLMQEAAQASSQADAAMAHHQLQSTAASAAPVQQFLMDGNGQQLLLTQQSHHHQQQQQQQQQHRQIIVSQQPQQQQQQQQQQLHHHQHHQQLQAVKTQTGQTVIVQNHHHHNQQQQQHHRIASAAPQMVLQQNTATGQILLSQGIQGQVQLVASTTQPGQYVLQATGGAHHHHGGTHTTYMVAQPQTAVVHGQPQTVLVAQQGGHHHGGGGVSGGGGTKTIIILQQQPSSTGATSATQHQKVVVTPQGQQMVVTQVHRPVLQTSQVTNNILPSASSGATSVIKATPIAPAPSPLAQAQVQMSPATAPTSVATVVVSQPQPLSHHQQQGQTHTLINNTQNSNVISSTASTTVATMTASVVSTSSSVANGINSSNSSSNDAVRATNVATATAAEKRLQAEDVKPKLVRDMTTPFVCEWGDCHITTKFKSANQVYMHVCEAHCPKGSEEIVCQWERCDNMKRKRFSLMTHIHDKHCNTEAMKQGLIRRKQTKHSSKVEPPPPPAPSTPHPGYAPDAALHAIKRHALEFVNPKELQQKAGGAPAAPKQSVLPAPAPRPSPPEQDDNEGPVTKSIRLTASLILRNLVIYSSNCRRYLKHYEPHLANVALSNVESSRTIAQVLYDMNEGSSHR